MPKKLFKPGPLNPNWKGGVTITPGRKRRHVRGYVLVCCPDHPHAFGAARECYEHRLVMEQKLGRYLEPGEQVSHMNGKKDDNRPENLELFSSCEEHMKAHWQRGDFKTIPTDPETGHWWAFAVADNGDDVNSGGV